MKRKFTLHDDFSGNIAVEKDIRHHYTITHITFTKIDDRYSRLLPVISDRFQ